MKISVAPLLYITALLGWAHAGPGIAAAPQQATTEAVSIDDTPIEPLQVGGSISLLQDSGDLHDPLAPAWRNAQEYRMELSMAPPVHQSVNLRFDPTASAQTIFVRAASDGKKIYLRLRWPDDTRDNATTRTDFADAAAVQFDLSAASADGATTTSFMMGSPDSAVNIWYWKAGKPRAQNLAAGGFGSTTQLEQAGLESTSVYRNQGEWIVVFSRPLLQVGDHLVNLESGTTNAAFAVWQGDGKQRDGLKHVSMGWVKLEPAL